MLDVEPAGTLNARRCGRALAVGERDLVRIEFLAIGTLGRDRGIGIDVDRLDLAVRHDVAARSVKEQLVREDADQNKAYDDAGNVERTTVLLLGLCHHRLIGRGRLFICERVLIG